jgi:KDO2-lipid IV(A) lauroyltransferase
MTSFTRKISFGAEALGWNAYQGLFRSMGLQRASDFGAGLLRKIGPLSSVQHVARVNMRVAFPDAHERELDQLLDAMWDNFGRVLGEFPNMHRFDFSGESDQIEVEGAEILEALDRAGQPAVLVGGHFANWELLAAVIVRRMKDCRITYRHANNPAIDRAIIEQRKAYGVKILSPKGGSGAKELMAALKAGASVGLMNDQKMNDGIAAPFLGREAMTASGPVRMALRYGCPLVPMNVVRKDGVRFKVTVYEPLEKPDGSDAAAILETVTRINALIESWIMSAPEQWFWVHRRFEKSLYRKSDA